MAEVMVLGMPGTMDWGKRHLLSMQEKTCVYMYIYIHICIYIYIYIYICIYVYIYT